MTAAPTHPDTGDMAAIARAETAAIYTQLAREHNTTSRPLPASDTDWERRRLATAAHALRGGQ